MLLAALPGERAPGREQAAARLGGAGDLSLASRMERSCLMPGYREKDEPLIDIKLLIVIIIVLSKGRQKELPAPLATEPTGEVANLSHNL